MLRRRTPPAGHDSALRPGLRAAEDFAVLADELVEEAGRIRREWSELADALAADLARGEEFAPDR